ncbi:hypothetical protein JQ634_03820 [Bradyrhizobium sp. AUGA SZCCT0240]|uniref:hypothetical protein n=1 Tax=unclassified Bradyrhizobium TaxID=2631580 RepID=UPI001BA44025|nr:MULTISPECIES: hypothetical protein [unclassified Bradyrhizobium]MBR1192058.1 hypothetical protein [Bradyrhizobium sp. AUGA SZCCT0160]MBR1194430.1 hypothetical protein [Bradyrhizobium sp. AUGA SZCCT0158]MBR1245245.1 hypothetical protein [Bradyrhizobium sp. AUGA SZCCT0274]MBR1252822.1 hypothetical protein [Bradyrhizobium sp. AUGA SZCCT0240]
MAKGKDKPSKQTKKPKSDKPKGSGSSYQQEYAMQQAGLQLPTQSTSGQARYFCGAAVEIAVTDHHVQDAHMDSQHA